MHVKLYHWDHEIRLLSARGLAKIAPLDPDYFAEHVLPFLVPKTRSSDLLERHGSILALGECTLALQQIPYLLSPTLVASIRNVIPRAEKARAYRGRGGQMVRSAACRFIECLALAQHPLQRRAVLRLLQTVEECLRHPHEDVQSIANSAFRALSHAYLNVPEKLIVQRLVYDNCEALKTNENPAARRGSAIALGSLPQEFFDTSNGVANVKDEVLNTLLQSAVAQGDVSMRDAETRCNSVSALADLIENCGVAIDGHGHFTSEDITRVIKTLFECSQDYATDSRGDVGSWVRKAAVDCLTRITEICLLGPFRAALALPTRIEFIYNSGETAAREQEIRNAKGMTNEDVWDSSQKRDALELENKELLSRDETWLSIQEAAYFSSPSDDSQRILKAVSASPTLRKSMKVDSAWGRGTITNVLASGAVCDVQFGETEIGYHYFYFGNGRIHRKKLKPICSPSENLNPIESENVKELTETYLPTELRLELLRMLLRLQGEKLDSVRARAGEALARLLHGVGVPIRLPAVPHESELCAAFPASGALRRRVKRNQGLFSASLLSYLENKISECCDDTGKSRHSDFSSPTLIYNFLLSQKTSIFH